MEEKFVAIGIFQNVHKAYILRDRLEIEGVRAWVTDENTVVNNPFFTKKLGGAKLNVRLEDEVKAKEIINALESHQFN